MAFLASFAPYLVGGLAVKGVLDALSPKQSAPQVPQVPQVASDADTAAAADAAAKDEQRKLARGRTSTMLTGGTGLSDMGSTSKVLLGQ